MNKGLDKYSISVLMAGFCWGFMGFFTRNLATFGIGPKDAIIVRCGVATICFGLLILFTNPKQIMIKIKDIWCFLGSGILSLLFFTYCYFNAIELMSLSVAAILLYTAPTIVVILSAILFKEKLTKKKVIALVLAFVGCCLVSGIAKGNLTISFKGLLFGLGSGLGYALYTIFSRTAIDRGYHSNVINFYSCLFATVGAVALWGVNDIGYVAMNIPASIWWFLSLGAVTCFLPYMLYTYGLLGLENGKASVLASLEPVVASLVGIIIYHESISLFSFMGIVLVLLAVVFLNIDC